MSFAWLWLLVAAAVVGFVAGLVLLLGSSTPDDAKAILAGRVARGEMDQDEFERAHSVLGRTGRVGRAARIGLLLVVGSFIAIVGLGGLAVMGALPRPGPASVGPGSPGFVAGTVAAPRVVRIVAGPEPRFYPDVVPVVAGETITFEVTTMGWTAHEFMVGPGADVAADKEGTPEVADIGMMQSRILTFTFTGNGPFSFACHAPGHYEAGMRGTIAIQP